MDLQHPFLGYYLNGGAFLGHDLLLKVFLPIGENEGQRKERIFFLLCEQ